MGKHRLLVIFIALYIGFSIVRAQNNGKEYVETIERAFHYVEQGEKASAIVAFQKALKVEPGNPMNGMVLSNMGTLQRELNEYPQALDSYNMALFFLPGSSTLYYNRGLLHCQMDSLNAAMSDFSRTLIIAPDHKEALYQRGLLYLGMNDTTYSVADFQEILRLEPESMMGRMGLAAWNVKVGAFENAERLYTIVQTKWKKDPSVAYAKAEMYWLWGKYGRALQEIDKAIDLDENDAQFYVLKGRIRLAQFETKLANLSFDRALELGFDKEEIAKLRVKE